MDNKKLIKTTKVIDRCLKIISGFLKAGIIVCAVFFILLLIFGEKIIASASKLDFGMLTITTEEAFIPSFDSLRPGIAFSLAAAAIICGTALYIAGIIRGILKPMLEGRPFEDGTANKIRKLAFACLIGGFVIEICRNLSIWFELRAYDIGSILSSSAVRSFKINYTLDTGFAVTAILLLLLSHIFRYGENLQRESDETL
ncbi:MAG: hypothetical protein MJ067_01255 [Oscillospiraceae bacterium]|nr:hypothetical protein [Oscillospiraceae bacterium]